MLYLSHAVEIEPAVKAQSEERLEQQPGWLSKSVLQEPVGGTDRRGLFIPSKECDACRRVRSGNMVELPTNE